jgi:hypothetical protein
MTIERREVAKARIERDGRNAIVRVTQAHCCAAHPLAQEVLARRDADDLLEHAEKVIRTRRHLGRKLVKRKSLARTCFDMA